MRNDGRYDPGSVVPHFHGEDHRLQLAFLVIIEEDELNGYSQLIIRPAKEKLSKAIDSIDENDAQDFVRNFQGEFKYMEMIRALSRIFSKEKKDAAHDTSSTLDRQQ